MSKCSAPIKSKILQQCVNNPAGIYMVKAQKKNNSRTRCEICLKLTQKTPEQHHCNAIGVALVSLLLTLNLFHTLFFSFYC